MKKMINKIIGTCNVCEGDVISRSTIDVAFCENCNDSVFLSEDLPFYDLYEGTIIKGR